MELELGEINNDLVREFEKLEPTGCENPMPTFQTRITNTKTQVLTNHPRHIRVSVPVQPLSFMYFDGAPNAELLQSDIPKDVIFEFQKMDESQIQVKAMLKDLKPQLGCERSLVLALYGNLMGTLSGEDEKITDLVKKLRVDRETFVEYYKLLRGAKGKRAIGVYDLYEKLQKSEITVDPYQLAFVAAVLCELGILRFAGTVQINEGIKTELDASNVYKKITNKKEK